MKIISGILHSLKIEAFKFLLRGIHLKPGKHIRSVTDLELGLNLEKWFWWTFTVHTAHSNIGFGMLVIPSWPTQHPGREVCIAEAKWVNNWQTQPLQNKEEEVSLK